MRIDRGTARGQSGGALLATLIFAACVFLAIGKPSMAQQPAPPAGVTQATPGGVAITIADELVLPPGDPRIGKAVRDSAGNLITKPGDIIRYTLTAVNGAAEPAYGVEMVDPIPRGTEFVIGSAAGVGMAITYSIDGGNFFQPAPILYDFRNPDGTIEKRHVRPAEYTHVKWVVDRPVPPRSRVTATVRVRVSLPDRTGGQG